MNAETSPHFQETGLIPRTTITQIVADFHRNIERIKAVIDLIAEINATSALNASFRTRGARYQYRDTTVDEAIRDLKLNTWRELVNKMEIRRILSIKKAEELDKQLDTGDGFPEITEENILGLMRGMLADSGRFIEEAIKEVYDHIRPWGVRKAEHVTNEKNRWQLGRKIILTGHLTSDYGGGMRNGYYTQKHITALDNVFHALDGKPPVTTHYGPLYDAIEDRNSMEGETEYFRFKKFLNGNLHVEFKRMDLVARFNAVAGGARLKDTASDATREAHKPEPKTPKPVVKKTEISEAVADIIKRSKVADNVVKLPEKLDRKTYEAVAKVMTDLGGKWNRSKVGFLFSYDPTHDLNKAIEAGASVNQKAIFQAYYTPADIARQVVELANIQPGHRILEPSAGTGNLLKEMPGDTCRVAVEINERAAASLFPWAEVIISDFLTCNGDIGMFDRIVMNPPFANGADIRHIEHAFNHLKPGGRLVAICPNVPRVFDYLGTMAGADLQEWIRLPEGSFKESGTNVNVAIAVIDKEVA